MEFKKMNPDLQIGKEGKGDECFMLAPLTLLTIITSK
jgi:hypothetical protein